MTKTVKKYLIEAGRKANLRRNKLRNFIKQKGIKKIIVQTYNYFLNPFLIENYSTTNKEVSITITYLFGCGVVRKYGFTIVNPFGNFAAASSVFTAGVIITSSPSFQSAGVAT